MSVVRGAAAAKLNLRLCVLARETGGYHQIETIFCALELADDIEIDTTAGNVTLAVAFADGAGADLGPPAGNLALRAAHAYFEATRLPPRAALRLLKRIPVGAGLGGGSSDAATVLRLLNRALGRPLDPPALLRLGAGLGSDVPFFLSGASLALGWGRGGRLLPLPALPPRHVLLAVPPVAVDTAGAYAAFAAQQHADVPGPAVLPATGDWSAVETLATNDFEPVIFARLPLLRRLRDAVASAGASFARMTGSGSVVYGIFEAEPAARAAAQRLESAFEGVRCIVTRTMSEAGEFPGEDSNLH